jgi:hypothetical protein
LTCQRTGPSPSAGKYAAPGLAVHMFLRQPSNVPVEGGVRPRVETPVAFQPVKRSERGLVILVHLAADRALPVADHTGKGAEVAQLEHEGQGSIPDSRYPAPILPPWPAPYVPSRLPSSGPGSPRRASSGSALRACPFDVLRHRRLALGASLGPPVLCFRAAQLVDSPPPAGVFIRRSSAGDDGLLLAVCFHRFLRLFSWASCRSRDTLTLVPENVASRESTILAFLLSPSKYGQGVATLPLQNLEG